MGGEKEIRKEKYEEDNKKEWVNKILLKPRRGKKHLIGVMKIKIREVSILEYSRIKKIK